MTTIFIVRRQGEMLCASHIKQTKPRGVILNQSSTKTLRIALYIHMYALPFLKTQYERHLCGLSENSEIF